MDYSIHTDVRFGPLELVDAAQLAADTKDPWWNQTLCRVNDSVVRLGVFTGGTFHWHKHDLEDEYFHVVSGRLHVDLEDRSFDLAPGQGVVVPRGVVHRTRVEVRTVVLMIEAATVTPTGD